MKNPLIQTIPAAAGVAALLASATLATGASQQEVAVPVAYAVPLASLGLHDVAGKTIGFDASVGIANPAGDQRDRAAHWAGLSEGRVVDRPGSAELLPHTWGTLTFAPAAK